MRFFDEDRIGVYLDSVNLRLERTKDGTTKVVDLTCRVQPFSAELANALHPDVRPLLFTMNDATPKPILKAVDLKLPTVEKQIVECYLLPEGNAAGAFAFHDVEVSDPRVRTEKGVDGFALVFYLTVGPVGQDDLEYITKWYSEQRFVTFNPSQSVLDFAAKAAKDSDAPPRRAPKAAEVAH